MRTPADRGRGYEKGSFFADVLYGRPLRLCKCTQFYVLKLHVASNLLSFQRIDPVDTSLLARQRSRVSILTRDLNLPSGGDPHSYTEQKYKTQITFKPA